MGTPSKGKAKRIGIQKVTQTTLREEIPYVGSRKANVHVYMTKQEKEKDELVTFSDKPHRTEIRNVWKKWR